MDILSIILKKYQGNAIHYYGSCTTGTYHSYTVDVPHQKQGICTEYVITVYYSGRTGYGI